MPALTTILSNGSRWAGQSPATLDELVDVLAAEPLDVDRFPHGFASNCRLNADGQPDYRTNDGVPAVQFLGNFARVSHVFNIVTSDEHVIARLSAAIRHNLAAVR